MTAPCSRSDNDFGQCCMGYMGQKEPLPAQDHLSGMHQFIYSFDRRDSFGIG